jgi:hypothetical protein
MKRDKKYYIILCIITFICCLFISFYKLYDNITGFIILLIPISVFNLIWYLYQNTKKE